MTADAGDARVRDPGHVRMPSATGGRGQRRQGEPGERAPEPPGAAGARVPPLLGARPGAPA